MKPYFAVSDFTLLADLGDQYLGLEFEGSPPDRVFVCSVDSSSWAALRGLEAGDELVSINGRTPRRTSMQEFSVMVRRIRPLRLRFLRTTLMTADPAELQHAAKMQEQEEEEETLDMGSEGALLETDGLTNFWTGAVVDRQRMEAVQEENEEECDENDEAQPYQGFSSFPMAYCQFPEERPRLAPPKTRSALPTLMPRGNGQTLPAGGAPREECLTSLKQFRRSQHVALGILKPSVCFAAPPLPPHQDRRLQAQGRKAISRKNEYSRDREAFLPSMLEQDVTSKVQHEMAAARSQAEVLRKQLSKLRVKQYIRGLDWQHLELDIQLPRVAAPQEASQEDFYVSCEGEAIPGSYWNDSVDDSFVLELNSSSSATACDHFDAGDGDSSGDQIQALRWQQQQQQQQQQHQELPQQQPHVEIAALPPDEESSVDAFTMLGGSGNFEGRSHFDSIQSASASGSASLSPSPEHFCHPSSLRRARCFPDPRHCPRLGGPGPQG